MLILVGQFKAIDNKSSGFYYTPLHLTTGSAILTEKFAVCNVNLQTLTFLLHWKFILKVDFDLVLISVGRHHKSRLLIWEFLLNRFVNFGYLYSKLSDEAINRW